MTPIIGIKINNRLENAISVQEIFTQYVFLIKTRLGLHQEKTDKCSPTGLILLEIIDDKAAIDIANELCDIDEIEIQQIRFN